MRLKQFVKLTGYTCAGNSLTNFEYEAHAMTGNGNHMNMYAKTYLLKTREITSSKLNFGGFYPFETTVLRGLRRTATRTMTHWPSAGELDFLRGHMYWMRKFESSLVNPPGPPT